jgi:CheY-like chemotaxis protein
LIGNALGDRFEIVPARATPKDVESARAEYFDLALVDLPAPEPEHQPLVDALREAFPGMPILLLSSDPMLPEIARDLGADAWVAKPFPLEELRHTVAVALSAAAALAPFRPGSHWVRFYRSRLEPAASVAAFMAAGFRRSEGVIAIVRPEHRLELERLFRLRRVAPIPGQLLWFDADAFMEKVNSEEDCRADLLRETASGWFGTLREAGFADIRVFGEGVDVLACRGRYDLARKVEETWHGIAAREQVHVYCTYDERSFDTRKALKDRLNLAALHDAAV